MEQFRQIGEVLGSMKALMVFKSDIQINRRQCSLLLDIFNAGYESIAEEMVQNLKFEEKITKSRVIEPPLKELLRVFKEGESYIKRSLEPRDWWAKAITLYQNKDCVEFCIHNLLFCISVVIEAIESVGESSGLNEGEIQKKRFICSIKYHREWKDPKLFQWRFGKQYLVTEDFCNRINTVWDEDRWILLNKIREKKNLGSAATKFENGLVHLLMKNLEESNALNGKLLPFSVLVGSKDYQVKRRLGNGSQYKEIVWLGEYFVLRHFFGNIEPMVPEITRALSLSHPNIMNYFCGFTDEDKKECFLVMELMTKDLCSYIKEICGPKKRIPFTLPVAVDIMLQIGRGMEYLHSKKIYHGDLKPYNILVKSNSTAGYLHAKVSGFGLSSIEEALATKNSYSQHGGNPFIWYAPEVLLEQEQAGNKGHFRYTEKSDVYSFGMVCFELLTGKVPFEDGHLQGDKISRNIRAGERPLFPFNSPKYVTNLTKKCWHSDPNQRPSFSSICRILRYIKRFLIMNPDHSQPKAPMPLVDYCDIENGLLKRLPSWDGSELCPITQIPFQIFAYRVVEKEKTSCSLRNNSESESDGASISGDENGNVAEESFPMIAEKPSVRVEANRKLPALRKSPDVKTHKPVTPKGCLVRPPQFSPRARTMRMKSESQLTAMSPRVRRMSGHASDSELS